jgi:hypothetical protein
VKWEELQRRLKPETPYTVSLNLWPSVPLNFLLHMLFHGNMGQGSAVITFMTPHSPLLDPTLLYKGLLAFWTNEDPFYIMDISFIFHREKPPKVKSIGRLKRAIAFFPFAT